MKLSNSHKWLVGLLAISTAGFLVWFGLQNTGPTVSRIPLPDFTTANVSVATLTNISYEQVEQQPRSAEAWGKYGEVLMAHEWNSDALICFENAERLAPTEMRWPYLSGVILDRRDPAAAVTKYELAQARDTNYPPLFMRMGSSLLRLNRTQDAEQSFRKAAELNPKEPQPLINLARLESARGKWQQAATLLEKALELQPLNREAIIELTRAQVVLGTAKSLSREAQAALMSGEKFETMPDPILQSINDHEASARVAAMKADATVSEGDPQKAAEAFTELIKKRPDLARPRINLATIYMSEGQYPLALVTLRELVQRFPDDPMGHLLLSYALQATQAATEARQEVETAIRLKPDYADAHFALGMSAEQSGEFDKAIEAYRAAVRSNARHVQARVALGLALKRQGKLDEAITEITAATRLAPGDRVAQSYLEKAIAERNASKISPASPPDSTTAPPKP